MSTEEPIVAIIKKISGFWKYSAQLLPIGYIIMICLGYFHLQIYYSRFDIDILQYLTLTELLFLFLPLTTFLVPAVLLYFVLDSLINSKTIMNEESLTFSNKASNFKLLIKKCPILYFLDVVLMLFTLLYPIALGMFYALHSTFNWDLDSYLMLRMIATLVWVSIVFIKFMLGIILDKRDMSNYKLVIAIFIGVFIFNEMYEYYRAVNILDGNPNKIVTIKLKDQDDIESNFELVYIGQTENYVFLRNIKAKYNRVISKREIVEMGMFDIPAIISDIKLKEKVKSVK